MIERRSDGRFRVRMPVDGKRPTLGTFDTEAEAARFERACLEVRKERRGTSVREHGEKVLTERELGKKVRRPEGDWRWWNNHLRGDEIASLAVVDVRKPDVLELVDRLRKKDLEHQTVENILNVLRVVFRDATERGLIATNPAHGLKLQRPAATEEDWTYATPEQQARLFGLARPEEADILRFAVGSGLRAGEHVTLRLRDVVTDGADPHVMVRYGGAPTEPTKSGRIRRVPLLPLALDAARSQKARLEATRRKNPHALLFPSSRGGFRPKEHIFRWPRWQELLEQAGLKAQGFRWHDLRHTCASSLVSGWWGRRWTLEEIAKFLGHTDVKTTQIYAHLAEDALRRAARETPGALAQLVPNPPLAPSPDSAAISWLPMASGGEAFTGRMDPGTSPDFAHLRPGWAPSGHTAALALLSATERRDEAEVAERLPDLARLVLARQDVRLALAVLEGGPFALARGLELASLLLEGGTSTRKAAAR